MASKILIVDPLTLVGREFARCLEEATDLFIEVEYRHTSPDDEHQISELGAQPALVPPIDGPDEIADAGIIVVTSDTETERSGHLENLLIRHPDVRLVDVGRLPSLAELTSPAIGSTVAGTASNHLRVAHPALVAAASVLAALRSLQPVRGSIAAVDPVSSFGRDALEILVHQASRKMQGGAPDDSIDGHVLAFNQVAVDADALTEEAADLIPDIPLAVTRILAGNFHGHVAHLSIELAEPVDDSDLREAFEMATDIVVAEAPISLAAVPDRDHILLAPPQLSPDRRIIAVTAMMDGLKIGGALTAVDILRAMIVN